MRICCSAALFEKLTVLLHLPRDWPWEHQLDRLYDAAFGPPATADP